MPKSFWKPTSLEEVRDRFHELQKMVLPKDLERPANHFRFVMPNGNPPSLRLIGNEGLKEPMALTTTALAQLASHTLVGGKKFYNGILALSQMKDPEVRPGLHKQLAEAVINEFLIASKELKLIRTFQQLPSHGPVVRAVLSKSYGVCDDIDLVKGLLDNPDTRNLPVISVHSTDSGTRIRLALDPRYHGESPTQGQPIELLEIWNSEVGRRGVWGILGLWKLVCTNGMTGFSSKLRYMWRHVGKRTRILSGLREFVKASKAEVSGALESYQKAAQIEIENLVSFIDNLSGSNIPQSHRLSQVQAKRVQVSLGDPSTSKTESGNYSLASIVDAMTLSAQEESDLFESERIEHSSGYVLRRGLAAPEASKGVIRVRSDKKGKALISW